MVRYGEEILENGCQTCRHLLRLNHDSRPVDICLRLTACGRNEATGRIRQIAAPSGFAMENGLCDGRSRREPETRTPMIDVRHNERHMEVFNGHRIG